MFAWLNTATVESISQCSLRAQKQINSSESMLPQVKLVNFTNFGKLIKNFEKCLLLCDFNHLKGFLEENMMS